MFRTLVYSKSEAHSKHCQTPAMENFAKKHTFRPQPSTFFSKTTRSEKNLLSSQNKVFLIFLKMEPCTFRPRPPKFFPKKSLDFFLKKPALKKFLIVSQKSSKLSGTEASKNFGTFLYFRKLNFLIFWKILKTYSEP